jgi:hypothetical protein
MAVVMALWRSAWHQTRTPTRCPSPSTIRSTEGGFQGRGRRGSRSAEGAPASQEDVRRRPQSRQRTHEEVLGSEKSRSREIETILDAYAEWEASTAAAT